MTDVVSASDLEIASGCVTLEVTSARTNERHFGVAEAYRSDVERRPIGTIEISVFSWEDTAFGPDAVLRFHVEDANGYRTIEQLLRSGERMCAQEAKRISKFVERS